MVTFNSVEELYGQYMKTLADIRETDRFILELEETHRKEIDELTQREFLLKENLEQVRLKLEQTRTDFNIQSLAKQVLNREQQQNRSTISTKIQTDMNLNDVKVIEHDLKRLQRISNEKDLEHSRIHDHMK